MPKNNSVLAIHMGEAFERLSPLLQQVHIGKSCIEGIASVRRGNLLANFICNVFRFPKENKQVKLRVLCEHTADSMYWDRDFDGLKMTSSFKRKGDFLVEYLGPLAMSFKAVESKGALHYNFIKTQFYGLSIPNVLSPKIVAYEQEVNGEYHFSVEVSLFMVRKVIAYSGKLQVIDL